MSISLTEFLLDLAFGFLDFLAAFGDVIVNGIKGLFHGDRGQGS